jgi:hypothetical protein
LSSAFAFTACTAVLDVVVLTVVRPAPSLAAGAAAGTVAAAVTFLVAWMTGGVASTLPWPKIPAASAAR